MTITADATAAPTTDETPLVTVKELGNRMFAYRTGTGAVLAEAKRSNGHNDSEWIGWAIWAAGHKTEVVISRLLARTILTEYALDLANGAR